MFSFGSTPLANTSHRGISLLAFGSLPVAEESQLRKDQEARDEATALIPAAVQASERKCPRVPISFPELNELLTHYIFCGASAIHYAMPPFSGSGENVSGIVPDAQE